MSIVIPGSSTILGMIKTQSMGSGDVTIKLPQNWYENNDLLGFALCCVYPPMLRDDESEDEDDGLICDLTVERNNDIKSIDSIFVKSWCISSHDSHSSDQMWVIYYPKDAIKEEFRSNQWTHFTTSFLHDEVLHGKECWIRLIYASCFQCRRHQPQECQRKLCLKGREIHELPLIEFPYELSSLCLRECKNLESLSSTIFELKSLTTLSCSGCSRLKSFPEIPPKGLENLRKLYLDGTAIQELPSSIQSLKGLQYLNLAYCCNLLSLPETICHLKSLAFLSCLGCSQLKSFPEIREVMENLRELYLDGTAIEELPTSIRSLKGLQRLTLSNCKKLVNLPDSIFNLRFLNYLNVSLCSKLNKFPQNLGNLQCLESLGVAGFDSNHFSSIPASIIQLSKLRILNLSHCQKLLQIPELPPTLRILDVHACPYLETSSSPSGFPGFSLLKCFKSTIKV